MVGLRVKILEFLQLNVIKVVTECYEILIFISPKVPRTLSLFQGGPNMPFIHQFTNSEAEDWPGEK